MFFLPVDASALPSSGHVCPLPCIYFIGGIKAMTHIDGYLLDRRRTQHVYILNGRSGLGKTQIALKYAQTRRRFFSEVLFIDGSSRDTVEQSYTSFIVSKHRGTTMEDSLRWLSTNKTNWLIVLDGANAPELEFRSILPSCSHESRLTRMNQEDSLDLLAKVTGVNLPLPPSSQELLDLIEDTQFLPIPLTLAGLYLKRNANIKFDEACRVYREEFRRILQEQSAQSQVQRTSSQRLVQAACTIGIRNLNDHASNFLQVLAFMHHRGVSEEIFQRAAERLSTYSSTLPPTETETRVNSVLKTLLEPFLDEEGTWSGTHFTLLMAELLDHSFLDFVQPGGFYSIPPCVHATIAEAQISDTQFFCRVATHLLALAIDPTRDDREELKFRQLISAHVNSVLIQGENISLDEAARFVLVYMANGQVEEAETLQLEVLEFRRRMLGEDHYLTLDSREQLETIYRIRGKEGPDPHLIDEDSLGSLPFSQLARANTLVSEDGIVKLTDFGLTIVQDPDVYISITEKGGGTERWMAPELLLEDTAVRSEKADVYALGMTFLEIFTGLPPFSNIRRNCAVVAMITRGEKVKYPEELSLYTRHSDRVWNLLQQCWQWKPGERPTAEQIKEALYEIM
ncbi:hypothetical protein FRC11_000759 [Ceratobasidium sp. 423]|nr:hypothetical protein FRC11_000759 [Ceratobasidium sp. 423]